MQNSINTIETFNKSSTTVESFAKTNKISKSKLAEFAEMIRQETIASLPKQSSKVSSGKVTGRPVLEKTKMLHQRIINAIGFGYTNSLELAWILKEPAINIGQSLIKLEKEKKIIRIGKAEKQGRGKKPVVFAVRKF